MTEATMTHLAKPYPTPDRQRWTHMVQFLDGTQIVGNSESELLDRWRSLGFWALDGGITRELFKERIVHYARVTWNAGLIGIGQNTPDAEFFDALSAERVLTIIRKHG